VLSCTTSSGASSTRRLFAPRPTTRSTATRVGSVAPRPMTTPATPKVTGALFGVAATDAHRTASPTRNPPGASGANCRRARTFSTSGNCGCQTSRMRTTRSSVARASASPAAAAVAAAAAAALFEHACLSSGSAVASHVPSRPVSVAVLRVLRVLVRGRHRTSCSKESSNTTASPSVHSTRSPATIIPLHSASAEPSVRLLPSPPPAPPPAAVAVFGSGATRSPTCTLSFAFETPQCGVMCVPGSSTDRRAFMNSPPLRASASIMEGNLAEESGSGM
jgi:hypothetical protein